MANPSPMYNFTDTDIGIENIPPQHTSGKIELYIIMATLALFAIVGSIGNAVVFFIFSKKKDRKTSTLFILALAFVDFTTCLIIIPFTIYMEYENFFIGINFLCKLYMFLLTSNIPFSAFIMVAIAIDRYFCICHPFLNALNIKRARILIGCICICTIGIGTVVMLMYGVYQTDTETHINLLQTNNTGVHEVLDTEWNRAKPGNIYTGLCQQNQIVLSFNFAKIYYRCYAAMFLVCLVIVLLLYVLIYHSFLAYRSNEKNTMSKNYPIVVKMADDKNIDSIEETILTTVNTDAASNVVMTTDVKNSTTEKEEDEDDKQTQKLTQREKTSNLKMAAMLFVVTAIFVVTYLPAFLMSLGLIQFNMIIFYMYFANNVVNAFVYSLMNKNFRDDLKKIFCGH